MSNQVEDPLDADHLFLSNESYIEKLNEFNEERRIKKQLESEASQISSANGEPKKKAEQDRILNFINTISFNVYDSLNKTLMKSEKNRQTDDSSLTDALNFMIGKLSLNYLTRTFLSFKRRLVLSFKLSL